jgi:hypothetical protein
MFRQRLARSRITLALALVIVAVTASACFNVSAADGSININYLCDGNIVCGQYVLNNTVSVDLAYDIYYAHCDYNNYCTAQTTYPSTGGDAIFDEALDDYNTMGNALYGMLFVCPGGIGCGADSQEWETRCLSFQIGDSLSVDNLLSWNLTDAYYVGGSWTWYRNGNNGCNT